MAVIGSTKWSCPSCTFHNWLSSVKCVLCGCPKPNDVTNPRKYRSQNPASLSWSKAPSSPNSNATSIVPQTPEIICADFNYPSVLDASPTTDTTSSSSSSSSSTLTQRTQRSKKWICVSCTYSNWPNANRCAMCGLQRVRGSRNEASISGRKEAASRSPKRSESILDYADIASYGEAVGGSGHVTSDDNTLTQARDPSSHLSKVKGGKHGNKTASNSENKAKKWKCSKCTYFNWTRAMKCIMCQAKRRTPSPPLSEDSAHHNPVTGGNSSRTSSAANSPTPPPAAASSSSSSHPHQPNLSPANSNTSILSSPSSSPVPANSNVSAPPVPTASERQTSSPSPTPTTLTSPPPHITGSSSNLTRTASASSSTSSSSPSSSSSAGTNRPPPPPQQQLKSASDQVRQIRNRFTNLDWLFINACLGVVSNEEAAVRGYLRQDGDRARQLTKDDCLVLGEASAFSVGSTLVHLAIK